MSLSDLTVGLIVQLVDSAGYEFVRSYSRSYSSVVCLSGQDRPGFHALFSQKKLFGVIFWPYNKSFIDKLVRSRCLDIGLAPFLRFYGETKSIKTHKKEMATIQPS